MTFGIKIVLGIESGIYLSFPKYYRRIESELSHNKTLEVLYKRLSVYNATVIKKIVSQTRLTELVAYGSKKVKIIKKILSSDVSNSTNVQSIRELSFLTNKILL